MQWDYRPEKPVFVDLETQSTENIRSVGGKAYLSHPSTRLLSAVFKRGNLTIIWVPTGRAPVSIGTLTYPPIAVMDDVPTLVKDWIKAGCTFVAHNAEGFDSIAWKRFGWGDPAWCDTMLMCRAGGLPAGLDRACKALGLEGKDVEGAAALKLLYAAKVRGNTVTYPVGTLPLWRSMLTYNVRDVEILAALYERVKHYGEPDVMALNAAINERGCPVDVPFARVLKSLWLQHQASAIKQVDTLTDGELEGTDIRSVPKVKAWLRKQGLDVASLDRKAIEQLMQDPDGYFGDTEDETVNRVRAVILARQQAVRATAGKVDRVFSVVDTDSRVRHMLVYHGALTGRWSGRDLQPHNMPRGVGKLDVEGLVGRVSSAPADMEELAKSMKRDLAEKQVYARVMDDVSDAAKKVDATTGDALATLMRPVICAGDGKVFASVDFGAIEARGTAWVAREYKALAVFADASKDIYLDMAKGLFGDRFDPKNKEQRQVGKVCVLGCGYGMGEAKFGASAGLMGVNLEAAGVTAGECVKGYRSTYPAIPEVWRALDNAVRSAIGGRSSISARCFWEMRGANLACVLPSGRVITYRNARIVTMRPRWNPTGEPVETIVYDNPRGFMSVLYGGLLCENVVQAISRDLLAHAMLQIEERWDIVLHVHDEIVSEVEECAAKVCITDMAKTMSTPPEWANGFPIRVEGFTCKRFVKAPFRDSIRVDAINGRIHD